MIGESSYAAVSLGDGPVSVLTVSGLGSAEFEFRPTVTMRDGTPEYLVTELGRNTPPEVAHAYPMSFVEDAECLVGSIVLPTAVLMHGVLGASLAAAGAPPIVDVLEIACPSHWGPVAVRDVRAAAMPLAREVIVVDAASAATHSVGQRAPSYAIVVELAELDSVVCAVTADGRGGYTRTCRWDVQGTRDLGDDRGAEASILDRVSSFVATQRHREGVDVFVLDTTAGGDAKVLAESPYRIHRMRGVDIVRSMAARAGLSIPADSPGQSRADPADDAGSSGSFEGETEDRWARMTPMPVRAAAWLDEVDSGAVSGDRRRRKVQQAVLVAVAVAMSSAVLVALVSMRGEPDRLADPSHANSASVTIPSASVPGPVTSSLPAPSTAAPAISAPRGVEDGPSTKYTYGRVELRIPDGWSHREEAERSILVPPDLPDRRIVVSTTVLRPGASFDEVADDLSAMVAARASDGVVGDLVRARDIGGRVALSYTESPDIDSTVNWQIFVENDLQISIGCQSRRGEQHLLDAECAGVVSTVTVAPE
ncbi:type VII secretion-associated protein [Rhodococcus sp. BP22]|uniref:type VII secretion-associated protein n=1 Tax=Rhodococcus sp. BP22 TaxID=2758566 RepID=UPI001645EA75|nr:type VII secretion-associated protein [Rhodococcus sp. BP22]